MGMLMVHKILQYHIILLLMKLLTYYFFAEVTGIADIFMCIAIPSSTTDLDVLKLSY